MKTMSPFLATLPLAVLIGFGCSADAGDTGVPLGSGGSASAAAGSTMTGVAGSVAGSISGVAGSISGVAGSISGVAGSASGVAGSSTAGGTASSAGATGQGGSGGGAMVMPTDGKGLYELNCKSCHAEQGVGSPLAPETQHPVRDYATWVTRN